MMKRRAFTLIEVMVVLSVLAIIAILAYNFFGGTMKEASLKNKAVEIHKILVDFDAAWDLYIAKKGVEPTNFTNIVSEGILIADPKLTMDIPNYAPYKGSYHVDLNGTLDVILYFDINVTTFTDDVCKKFNEMFTTLGATIPLNGTDDASGSPVGCMLDEGNMFFVVREMN